MAKARVLFTGSGGRVLLVRLRAAAGRPHWGLPGGTVEAGSETPRDAAVREVHEELGLSRTPGRLLSVDWVRRPGDLPRTVQVFDGGQLDEDDLARIRLDEAELAEWRMCTPEEAGRLMPPPGLGQLRESLAVRAAGGGPVELVDGTRVVR
uniref:NUDIX hydrolase n=1 Tax=Streptomyces sp. 31A4 TaxID=1415543 RepID=U5YNX3_9ACTN|nr:NUDIX hydrolase [Streptomyces sp. 31A4]